MNNNKHLFFYGLMARIKEFIGGCIIIIGFFSSLFFFFSNNSLIGWLILIGSLSLGLFINLNAKAQRFDYQRQSGSIIHQGDWK